MPSSGPGRPWAASRHVDGASVAPVGSLNRQEGGRSNDCRAGAAWRGQHHRRPQPGPPRWLALPKTPLIAGGRFGLDSGLSTCGHGDVLASPGHVPAGGSRHGYAVLRHHPGRPDPRAIAASAACIRGAPKTGRQRVWHCRWVGSEQGGGPERHVSPLRFRGRRDGVLVRQVRLQPRPCPRGKGDAGRTVVVVAPGGSHRPDGPMPQLRTDHPDVLAGMSSLPLRT
jgi:hypothetical protein